MSSMKTVNVSAVLDEGRWTGYQKLLIFGTALTIILDGVDNQLLPNALPRMMKDWGLPREAFLTALSSGPFGMMIGGALGGYFGDRIGRRNALLGSVLTFAVITLALAWVETIGQLTILRFLAGVGLGGAMPNAAVLASEYVPRRQRPFAVTLTIVCIPLGGVLAARMAGEIIPLHGWQPLFIAGGVVPIVLAVVLFFVLPESPRYLASRRQRWPELTRMLRRMGHDVPDDVVYVDHEGVARDTVTRDAVQSRVSIGELFAPAYLRDTIALCLSFFFCLMVNYIGILLIPVVFTGSGFEQAAANRVLEYFNYGGVAGAVIGALVIQRLGSRAAMLGMSALAVVVGLALAQMPISAPASVTLLVLMILGGALLNGVQTTMYALAAQVYPSEIRGTGVGTAVAFGRIGNVLAAWAGNRALSLGGTPGYFTSWSITMGIVLMTLALMTRHIPRNRD
jgi:AAHS family 4-hydroxybenzoate transporter-like MFS transporter